MSDIKDINPELDLHAKERILLTNKEDKIIPYTIASAVEMKDGSSIEEKIAEMEEKYAGILNSANDASANHVHDSLYYRKSEIDSKQSALEDRIASLNSSNHTHNQYALKTEVYTKIEFESKFGSLSDIITRSDLDLYVLKSQLSNYLTKDDATNYATKDELDNKSDLGHNHDERYYNRNFIDNNVIGEIRQVDADIRSYIATELERKANKDHTHSEYVFKNEVYTKNEIDLYIGDFDSRLVKVSSQVDINTDAIKKINTSLDNSVTTEILEQAVSELTDEINKKADITHTHDTDSIFYEDDTLTNCIINIYDEIDSVETNANEVFAPKVHSHDDLYYGRDEMDAAFTQLNDNISQTYATKKALTDGLSNKADREHTHEDIDERITNLVGDFNNHLDPEIDVHPQYANKENVYEKDEVDSRIQSIENNISTNYVTKNQFNEELELKSDIDHDHDDIYLKEMPIHNHDDLYYGKDEIDYFLQDLVTDVNNTYNKTEINTLLEKKSDIDHMHDNSYAPLSHNHDNLYYRREETFSGEEIIDLIPDVSDFATKDELSNKADYSHTHDDLESAIQYHNHNDKYYTKEQSMSTEEIREFVETAVTTGTIDMSAYATKEDLLGKADKDHTHDELLEEIVNVSDRIDSHNHNSLYYGKADVYNKVELDAKLELAAQDGSINMSAYATKEELKEKANKEHTHEELNSEIDFMNEWISKHSHSNFYTKDEVYKKSEVDDILTSLDGDNINIDLSSYAKKVDLDKKLDESVFDSYQTEINDLITNHTHNSIYYTKNETMSKDQINTAISDAINSGSLDMTGYVTKTYLETQLNTKADEIHDHDDEYSQIGHNHNDLYYKKSEAVSKSDFESKNLEITESIETINSNLDNKYNKSDVDTLLKGKADEDHDHEGIYAAEGHSHNNLYYTKAETISKDDYESNNTFITDSITAVDSKFNNVYTKTNVDNLLDNKADFEHNHDELYSPKNHRHDDLYYTKDETITKEEYEFALNDLRDSINDSSANTYNKNEIDVLLYGKADAEHNHDELYSPKNHKHDDLYYTKAETVNVIDYDSFVTNTEMDISNINTKLKDMYTTSAIDSILENKADLYHRHDDLYSPKNHKHDDLYLTKEEIEERLENLEIDIPEVDLSSYATKAEVNDKADAYHTHDDLYAGRTHNHNILYYTKEQIDDKFLNIDGNTINLDLSSYAKKTELLTKADKDHNHDDAYSQLGHTHNDKYYTKTEINNTIDSLGIDNLASLDYVDTMLSSKSDRTHIHEDLVKIDTFDAHKHDERYYTKTEIDKTISNLKIDDYATIAYVDTELDKKSDEGHTHTDLIEDIEDLTEIIETHNHSDLYYTKSEIDKSIDNLKIGEYATIEYVDAEFDKKSDEGHTHTDLEKDIKDLSDSLDSHNHNDLYYTRSQTMTTDQINISILKNIEDGDFVNNTKLSELLNNKSDKGHRHTDLEAKITENEANISNLLSHRHDDLYYTESEIDSKIKNINDEIDKKVDTEIFENALENKSDEGHDHPEFITFRDNISDLTSELESHVHTEYAKVSETYKKTEVDKFIEEIESSINDVNTALDTKASKTDLAKKADKEHNHDDVYSPLDHEHPEYALISNVYNKSEVDANISDAINQAIIDGAQNQVDLSIYAKKVDLDTKADKEHNHDEIYAPILHTHSEYANISNVYNKTEIDDKVTTLEETITLTDSRLNSYVSNTTFTEELAKKADFEHNHDELYSQLGHSHDDLYYGKNSVYNKEEVDNLILTNNDTLNLSQYVKSGDLSTILEGYSKTDHLHDELYSPLDHVHTEYALLKDVMLKQELEDKFTEIDINMTDISSKFSNYTTTAVLTELLNGKADFEHSHDETYAPKTHFHDDIYLRKENGVTIEDLDNKIIELDLASYAKINWVTSQLNTKSNEDHTHDDVYSPLGHNHNDLYYGRNSLYTKEEVDELVAQELQLGIDGVQTQISTINSIIAKKADEDHTHDELYSALDHTHDDKYYSKTLVYTKNEIEDLLSGETANLEQQLNSQISNLNIAISKKAYIDHPHDDVYSPLGHNHNELYYNKNSVYTKEETSTLIDDKGVELDSRISSEVTALNNKIAKKADDDHSHDDEYAPLIHAHDDKYYNRNVLYTKDEVEELVDTEITTLSDSVDSQIVTLNNKIAKKADEDHTHDDVYSPLGHYHDDRYYTKNVVYTKEESEEILSAELDTLSTNIANQISNINIAISKKADSDHLHDDVYAPIVHAHDDKYYNKVVLYTKEEIDERFVLEVDDVTNTITTQISNVRKELEKKADSDHLHDDVYAPIIHAHDDKYYNRNVLYTKEEVDELLTTTNEDMSTQIANINSILANKSDKTHNHDDVYSQLDHLHDDVYYNKSLVYNKTEIDNKVKEINETFENYALVEDMEVRLSNKADKLHNHDDVYYLKTETYNREEVDSFVTNINNAINNLSTNVSKNYVTRQEYEDRVSEVDNLIASNVSALNSHKTEYETFKKNVEENYVTNDVLSISNATLNSSINSVKTSLDIFKREVAETYTTIEDFTNVTNNLSTRITNNTTEIEKLRGQYEDFVLEADERFVLNDETYKNFYVNTNTNIAKLQTDLKEHKDEFDTFAANTTSDITGLRSRINTAETNITNLTRDFVTLRDETLPATYLTITAFNSYKTANDTKVNAIDKLLGEHITEYEEFVMANTESLTQLDNKISSVNNNLKNFIENVAPETYLDIVTFEGFKSSTNQKILNIENDIKEHKEEFSVFKDDTALAISNLNSTIVSNVASLNEKINSNYAEFQDHIAEADGKYATKQELSDFKSSTSKNLQQLQDNITALNEYCDLTFVTKNTFDTTIGNVNKSITELTDELLSHEQYAENTYATKTDMAIELAKKANITWVEEQLSTKSDNTHKHDELYLPITDAKMKGHPTAPTPEIIENSERIANTEWTYLVTEKLRGELDAKKLDRDENAVSASKWESEMSLTLSGSARGNVEFDGSTDVAMNVELTGNAPTASKWLEPMELIVSGDAEGTVTFDGSSNPTLVLNYTEGSSAPQANKWTSPMLLTLDGDINGEIEFDGSKDVIMNTIMVGNAPTASKLRDAVTINAVPFDGSKSIIIADDTKLPKDGGEMTGSLVMANNIPIQFKDSSGAARDVINMDSYNKIVIGHIGLPEGSVGLRSGSNVYPIRHAGFSDYDINGNAGSATKLETGRNFSITGAIVAAPVYFDGTNDVILNINEVKLDSTTLSGILPVEKGGTGNNWGEAPSATKLHKVVNINEALFDGSTNITIGTLEPIKIPANTLYVNGSNDLNNYKKPGMYFCDSSSTAGSLTNCPTKNAFSLLVEKHNGYHQVLTEYMTGNHKVFERNFAGNAWGAWYELYTTANEPSKIADSVKEFLTIIQKDKEGNIVSNDVFNGSEAKEVTITPDTLKVLPLSGGNLTGNLVFENNVSNIRFKNTGGTEFNALNMSTGNILNIGDVNIRSNINSGDNPTTTINGNTYTLYHTGNKPSAADVNAVARTGDSMTGSLSMQNNAFIKFPAAHNKVTLNNETAIIPGASVLSNSDANIRIATPYSVGFTPTTTGGKVTVGNNGVWIDAKNGNIYAAGNIYENADATGAGSSLKELYMGIKKDSSGYYGMTLNNSDKEWVRVTETGILPYKHNVSRIGTDTWNFSAIYGKDIYESNQKLSQRYLALHQNTTFENSKNISLSGNNLDLTLDRMQKCTSTFSNGRAYTIKLPSVSNVTGVNGKMDTFTIHILFTAMSGGTLSFTNASGLKWYATPQIISGKMHEFIFTYYNGTWVGGVIHYG